MPILLKQGQDIKLSLVSSDASAGVPLVISDANGVNRPLQSYERLVLDSLVADISGSLTVDVTDPGASVDEPELFQFSATSSGWASGGEGMNLSLGSTPVATASGGGAIVITGTGRIINGKTQGFQAGYKSLLTASGNVNGH